MDNTIELVNDTSKNNSSLPTTTETSNNNSSQGYSLSDNLAIASLFFTIIFSLIGMIIAYRQWKDPIKNFLRGEKAKRKSEIKMRGLGKMRSRNVKNNQGEGEKDAEMESSNSGDFQPQADLDE